MLKSELEEKYQNILDIAANLRALKDAYKEKCEILETYNRALKSEIQELKILLANKDASMN